MASQTDDSRSFTPGHGVFRPDDNPDVSFDPTDHMRGWSLATQNALDNFGRAPGKYHATLVLSATVQVQNPGNVIEYIAKFI
jgi:hypothetical protein